MASYTIHLPPGVTRAEAASTGRLRLVRDGFSLFALILPLIWLLWNRLWLILLAWIAAVIGIEALARFAGEVPASIVAVLFALWFAVEARDLQRWTLARRGWQDAGVVVASHADEAERRVVEAWLTAPTATAPAAPPAHPIASASRSAAPPSAIGLFPSPGGR
jgi:hypothetical protein